MPTGKKIKIEVGQRFGKLVVSGEGKKFVQPSGQTQRGIFCKCDCGQTTTVRLSHLVHGRITSCNCDKHGETGRIKRGWSVDKAIHVPIRKGNYCHGSVPHYEYSNSKVYATS